MSAPNNLQSNIHFIIAADDFQEYVLEEEVGYNFSNSPLSPNNSNNPRNTQINNLQPNNKRILKEDDSSKLHKRIKLFENEMNEYKKKEESSNYNNRCCICLEKTKAPLKYGCKQHIACSACVLNHFNENKYTVLDKTTIYY